MADEEGLAGGTHHPQHRYALEASRNIGIVICDERGEVVKLANRAIEKRPKG